MINKPFYYSTKHFTYTYHGGTCSPEHLRTSKRGKIKSFSRSSQKRLCIYLDSYKNFTPEWITTIVYDGLPSWLTVQKTIYDFTTRLTLPRYNTNIPLFFWKKNVINSNLVIVLMSNQKPVFSYEIYPDAVKYFWEHYSTSPLKTIDTVKIKDVENAIYEYCFINTIDCEYSQGKWWGIINRTHYELKKIQKKECTLLEVELMEIKLAAKRVKTSEIKRNLYKN